MNVDAKYPCEVHYNAKWSDGFKEWFCKVCHFILPRRPPR